MKGLMIKDLCLLLKRKQTLLIFLLICVVMTYAQGGIFSIGYSSMLMLIWALSTLSFDESGHGITFLLTLPVTRKIYVFEKYLFCLLACICGWLIGLTLATGVSIFTGTALLPLPELIASTGMLIPVLLSAELMIPVQLKYGQERSRLMMILFMMLIFSAAMAAANAADGALGTALERIPDGIFLIAGFLFTAVCGAASANASVRILEKKEL